MGYFLKTSAISVCCVIRGSDRKFIIFPAGHQEIVITFYFQVVLKAAFQYAGLNRLTCLCSGNIIKSQFIRLLVMHSER